MRTRAGNTQKYSAIRWRVVDLGESQAGLGSTKWTKVHTSRYSYGLPRIWVRAQIRGMRTSCGIIIPNMPYEDERDSAVARGAIWCKKCIMISGKRGKRSRP